MAPKSRDALCCNRLCQAAGNFPLVQETLCLNSPSTSATLSIALWISIPVDGKVEEACVAHDHWAET